MKNLNLDIYYGPKNKSHRYITKHIEYSKLIDFNLKIFPHENYLVIYGIWAIIFDEALDKVNNND